MRKVSEGKYQALVNMSNPDGIIGALAIDQRGALKKMMARHQEEVKVDDLIHFKELVSEELTPFASSILLDPEYGLAAAQSRDPEAGLLLAYEKTGYDATTPGRLPDLLGEWSVERLKAAGADAIKFLLYYDVDEDAQINQLKHVFVERLGSECQAADLPFFLEVLSYDAKLPEVDSKAYAQRKPEKVIGLMKEFSKPQYKVDVLKVEVPVNMNYVAGFAKGEAVHTKEEAAAYFKAQSDATHLPFIFLSAGVSASLFQETLVFAKEAGSTFNGVLCGRATWKDGVEPFVKQGTEAAQEWLASTGKQHIEDLNEVIQKTATSWWDKVTVEE
ncbi:MAG: tagatose-bisphosphate aldolase [Enterococcus casseliflavus]